MQDVALAVRPNSLERRGWGKEGGGGRNLQWTEYHPMDGGLKYSSLLCAAENRN